MAISNTPWSSVSEADYTPEQLCRAALIDLNPPGAAKTKALCKLPVREPDGTVNRNALGAAAAVLAGGRGGVDAPPADKRAAARKLAGIYQATGIDVPPALANLAR